METTHISVKRREKWKTRQRDAHGYFCQLITFESNWVMAEYLKHIDYYLWFLIHTIVFHPIKFISSIGNTKS